ncbi:MAG: DNA polymerase III subunit gamma/tau [Clostridia bacterium]|nr:DNA polymerase III subunit gamma/tau [Clostridia bacterium]
MHQALYRKYRPNVFDDVYGQEHITSILRYEAMRGSVSHAYLFSGSRGTGKTTCAKILAKSVNCLNPKDGNPCNECENCRAIDTGSTTDVIEMDAATNTGVDYIRDLRENVMYTPAMLKKRVYIIDEAHMLSDSAFNALLKTIEEPPEHVLYIFATTEQHKIPATIISRCQRFEFRRITMKSLVERLMYIAKNESINLTEDGATLIAKTAQGGMRDAISLMELCAGSHKEITSNLVNEILGTSSYEKMYNVAKSIAEKNYAKLFEAINEVVISSKDVLVFFADLTAFYRDMMVQKSNVAKDYLELLPSEYKLLEDASSLFSMATLIYHASLLDDAYANMMRNPTGKRLCAEITLMKMCDPRLSDSSDALLSRLSVLEDKITLISKGITVDTAATVDEGSTSESDDDILAAASEAPNSTEANEESKQPEGITELEYWDEIISKVVEKDAPTGSFLRGSSCCYSQKNQRYYLVVPNSFTEHLLNTDKNKKSIFDAMLLSEIDIASVNQLKIVVKKGKDILSDLDEFE